MHNFDLIESLSIIITLNNCFNEELVRWLIRRESSSGAMQIDACNAKLSAILRGPDWMPGIRNLTKESRRRARILKLVRTSGVSPNWKHDLISPRYIDRIHLPPPDGSPLSNRSKFRISAAAAIRSLDEPRGRLNRWWRFFEQKKNHIKSWHGNGNYLIKKKNCLHYLRKKEKNTQYFPIKELISFTGIIKNIKELKK